MHGWLIKRKDPRQYPTILHFHGNACNISHMLYDALGMFQKARFPAHPNPCPPATDIESPSSIPSLPPLATAIATRSGGPRARGQRVRTHARSQARAGAPARNARARTQIEARTHDRCTLARTRRGARARAAGVCGPPPPPLRAAATSRCAARVFLPVQALSLTHTLTLSPPLFLPF